VTKEKTFITVLLLTLALFLSGTSPLNSANRVQLEWELGSHTATENPFNRFPLLKLGFHHDFSRSFALGGSLAFTKWSDDLGMYGGTYTFSCYRPEIELAYLFPALLQDIIHPFVGIGFGYHFYQIENELNNAYPGELKGHFFLTPFLGANFAFGKKAAGIMKNIFMTVRLVWHVNGDFSGVRGSLGLGIRIN